MFAKERLILTAWYSVSIMLISLLFSLVIYHGLSLEINRALQMQRYRIEHPQEYQVFPNPANSFPRNLPFNPNPNIKLRLPDPSVLEEAKNRLLLGIIVINLTIFVISGGTGYILAGKTLKPIANMLEEQNRFIADSSHELRTPLTALKTSVEVSLRDKKMTLADAKILLTSSLEEINRLQILSDNLLRLVHTQNGATKRIFTQVKIRDIITEAIKKTQAMADNKQISLHYSGTSGTVKGDKQSLIDLLVIFIDNAIKYSPNKTRVKIISKNSNSNITVIIKDHGIGIESKDLPHIFDRFYRADQSRTNNETSGFGLGLSIAKQIVSEHNGTITVKSELNKGTCFTVRLPKLDY